MSVTTLVRNEVARFALENVSLQRPDGGPTTFKATSSTQIVLRGDFQLEHDGVRYRVSKLRPDTTWVGTGVEHAITGELVELS